MGKQHDRSYLATKDHDPYAYYQELLKNESGFRWDGDLDAWLVTSSSGCREILRNDDTLFEVPKKDQDPLPILFGGSRTLPQLAGKEHDKLYRWWLSTFSPARMAEWRISLIRPIVDRTIDLFIERGSAELALEFSERIPIRVIMQLMGLPSGDDAFVERYRILNHELVAVLNYKSLHPEEGESAVDGGRSPGFAAAREIEEMIMPYLLSRRTGDGTDLISELWRAGPGLLDDWTMEDMAANTRLMLQAGSDTTTYGISNAAYLLLTHPPLADELRGADEVKRVNFVEEVLRLHGPVHLRTRQAMADVTIGDHELKCGEKVYAIIAAANRDPSRFTCPDEVNMKRKSPRDHLAFHYGPHTCVGAALARAELLEASTALLSRFPDMRLDNAAEQPRMTGWLLRGYAPLHIRFTPGRAGLG